MKFNRGQQFENPPPGSHIARCFAVVDLGTQLHKGFEGKPAESRRDVRLMFELPNEHMAGVYQPELKGKPFGAFTTCKQSLHPKANLRKLLVGWRGRDFKPDELNSFDPKKLVGAPCRLALVQRDDFVNIDSISPLGKGEKCPKQVNPGVFFSLEPDEFDKKVYDKLSQSLREKIAASPEYHALMGGGPSEHPQEDPPDDHGQQDSEDPF